MSILLRPADGQRRLLIKMAVTNQRLLKAMESLSSGHRINRASDDPAGLIISEQLRARIGSLNKEIENVTLSIAKYDTVTSTVQHLRSQLTQMRSLAVSAANEGVYGEEAIASLQESANRIVGSFNELVKRADYNGQPTLDGSATSLARVSSLETVDFSSPEALRVSMEQVDGHISELDAILGDLAASQKYDLESRRASLEIERENLYSAESQIRHSDYGLAYSDFVRNLMQEKIGLAMLAHARVTSESILSLLTI